MKMKRFTALLLALALLLLSLASCAEYKPPVDGGNKPGGPGGSLDSDPTNDFTVSLSLDGEPFKPDIALEVYWTDGYDTFIAPLDSETGVARVDGLDGDYQVVLSSIPLGFGYDPNAYIATNYNKNIVIDVFKVEKIANRVGEGNDTPSSLMGSIPVSKTGVYSVTISEPGERFYFEYAPEMNGVYTIESWVSTVSDLINPIAYSYMGSSQYKFGEEIVDELGPVGSYTRNFVHKVEIAEENISSAGQVTFTFALTAEPKDGMYPITYNFAIKRDGGFDSNRGEKEFVRVEDTLSAFDMDAFIALGDDPAYTLTSAETTFKDENGNPKPGAMVFDQNNYRLWEISDGGDGVYHVYDEEKYASTGGYGPVLVVYISSKCPALDMPFTEIEYVGNSALSNVLGYLNYKQFIEGFDALVAGDYYCVDECTCHAASDPIRACPTGCTECHRNCRNCPEDMIGMDGYAQRTNSDGVAPVTAEMVEFLQNYAVSHRYFADGDGWAEKKGVYAYEDSQWLFACAYYVPEEP